MISSGTGTGQTNLAAFDAALWNAGIANFNLIKLSSIIPPGSIIKHGDKNNNTVSDFGKKLYVVLSECRESEVGREAWAGIGWVQAQDGRGLFVEQSGSQKSEVKRLITETLKNMMEYRDTKFGLIQTEIVGMQCESSPVCALVAAVYRIESWN
jgi:arginine decarboxylase